MTGIVEVYRRWPMRSFSVTVGTIATGDAHRDGFTAGVQAGRAAIIAMLRKPSESLLECAEFTRIVLDCARAIHSSEIPYRRILCALADHLSQPQNSDDNGVSN